MKSIGLGCSLDLIALELYGLVPCAYLVMSGEKEAIHLISSNYDCVGITT